MERELLEELEIIRKELEIPMEDYLQIMALAKMHCNRSKIHISDEKLYEIVIEALSSYDYEKQASDKQAAIEAMRLLINSERKKRHVSDEMLFDFLEDYLNIIDNNQKNIKSPEEVIDRAIKSLI